jgi:hypothetical protein
MRKQSLIFLALALPLATAGSAAARTPASDYRTGTIDPRARRVPAEIRRGVFAEPERYLAPLVRSLIGGVGEEFHQVKILHDWVADNIAYDVESYLSGARVESAWENTLRRRKGVCHGYAVLLAEMCRLAGIPCEKVSGYGRGYRFGIGRVESVSQVNHAWNAVKIGGQWYLVDVTWDAGHVHERSFEKAYGTTYLFPEPQQFLYTHFPTDPQWQLLDPARTAQQFVGLPYLRGRFFEHGMRLATGLKRVTRVGESVQFALEVPDDVAVLAKLKSEDGAGLLRRTLLQREAGRCKVLVTFPTAGRWSVYVHSKRRGEPGELLLAASLEFEATSGTARTFPKTFGSYDSMDGCLYSPLYVPLPAGRPLAFKIRVRGTEEVSLAIGDEPWLPLARDPADEDVYRRTAPVPAGAPVRLTAKKAGGGNSHWTLVDFTPEPD